MLPVVLLALALAPVASRAGTIEGVRFAERINAGGTELELSSLALLRYKVLFKAYVAALYLPDGTSPEASLADVPKRLEIEYFWPIDGEKIGMAGEQILARNVSDETLAALRPRLDAIDALYQDIEPGDRYALTYLPGTGTELAKNGEPLGVIPGADFSAAYFAIWLGDDPIDASLRDQLLSFEFE
ncbi:MAG: chalcone isomerase family protein [Myxococcota bacterium]|nr:chalcone isomerase family protein [Myxococcota bacterium]